MADTYPGGIHPPDPGVSFRRVVDALTAAGGRVQVRGWQCTASCPAHEDRSPSLSVTWRNGKTLINCHSSSACTTEDVAAALELQVTDLFDDPLPEDARRAFRARAGQPAAKPARTRKAPASKKPAGPKPAHSFRRTAEYAYVDEDAQLLGWVVRQECAGCPDPKCTEKPAKTFRWQRPGAGGRGRLWTAPARRPLYHLPEVLAAAGAAGTVYVTEGEKSADALRELGLTATTHPGGASVPVPGQPYASKWVAEHTEAVTGAHVVIVADRDAAGYAHAAYVACELDGVAASVRVVRTPLIEDKADIIEHLAAGLGVEELEPVPAEALSLPAVEPDPYPDEGDADNVVNFPRRPDSGQGDDAGRGPGGGGPGGPVGPGGSGGQPIDRVERDEYAVYGDSLVKLAWRVIGRGENKRRAQVATEVVNVRVRLVNRVRRDNGDGTRPLVTHVDLEAERDGQVVTVNGVDLDAFTRCTWLDDLPFPGITYRRTHQGRSDVVNAIYATSGDVPIVTEYAALGWRQRESDGKWMFVHAGGALDTSGPVGGVRVIDDADLARYTLPAPPATDEELAAALDASFVMLDRLPLRIAAPLLGAVYRAVLGDNHASLLLVGDPATYKTSTAVTAYQHHAPGTRHDSDLLGAGEEAGTATWLEDLRHAVGHLMLLADDSSLDAGEERATRRLNTILRSQYNRSGKGRGKRDGGRRTRLKPRSLLTLTAEHGASGSAETRTLYIPFRFGDVDLDALQELQARTLAACRGQLTAALITYAAARMPLEEWIQDRRAEYTAALYAADQPGGIDARAAGLAADLAVGWRAVLDLAVDRGVLDVEGAQRVWERAWTGLAEVKQLQASVTARRNPPERAADLLRSALVAGRAHVTNADGGTPEDYESLGYAAPAAMMDGARAQGVQVGWTDGTTLWLDPGAAVAAIEAQGHAERNALGMGERTLQTALHSAGVLRTESSSDGERYKVREVLSGRRRRVWELPLAWLFPDADDTGGDPGTGGVPPAPLLPGADPAPPTQHQDEDQEQEAPAPIGEQRPEPSRPAPVREQSGATPRFLASAAVLDTHGACLTGGVSWLPLPELRDLADVAAWAETTPLGMGHSRAPADDGQVWIMPELGARIGLPEQAPERPRTDAERRKAQQHRALRPLMEAGWNVSRSGLAPWFSIWRDGGRTIRIAVVGWLRPSECQLIGKKAGDPLPSTGELAYRLGLFERHVGRPFAVSGAATGMDLIDLTRREYSRLRVTEPITTPKPATPGYSATRERDFLWHRRLTPDERKPGRFLQAYDLRGQYLAASSSARLGIAEARQVGKPLPFDPEVTAYWQVDPPRWEHALLPDPFDPSGRGRKGPVWLATPTLKSAAELFDIEPEPLDAYVWDESTAYLEHWYGVLRKAVGELEPAKDDPDVARVVATVKGTYAGAIGQLGSPKIKGRPMYRPDWRHQVVARARANLLRHVMRVVDQSGRCPVAIAHDCLVYVIDGPDPIESAPAGLKLDERQRNRNLGNAKPEPKDRPARPVAELAELLDDRRGLLPFMEALTGESIGEDD